MNWTRVKSNHGVSYYGTTPAGSKAYVYRQGRRWEYSATASQGDVAVLDWGVTGGPQRSRRLAEAFINRKEFA